MKIPVSGSLIDWLPPLAKPNTSPYELNPRNIGATTRAPASTSNAADYMAARRAVNARNATTKTTATKSSGTPQVDPYASLFAGLQDSRTFEDYMAEANKIYKPSLDYLTGQEKATSARAGQFDKDLAGMYEALVKDIRGQGAGITSNYNDAVAQQGQITSNAKAAVGNNYSQSQAQQMAMLKQLGIEAAAPDTLQKGQDSQAFYQSLLDTQGAAGQSFLNSEKAASQQFNTSQANIAAQTGTNARADLKMQLQDILGQLAGKKADLKTQINQQAVQMQSGAAQSMMDQAKLRLQYDELEQRRESDRAQAEYNAARLALDSGKSSGSNTPNDPWSKVIQLAGTIYPNSTASTNAVKAVQDAINIGTQNKGSFQTSADLLHYVLQRVSPTGDPYGRDVADRQQLQALVDYAYKQLFK